MKLKSKNTSYPPGDIKTYIRYDPESGFFTRTMRADGKPNRDGERADRHCGNGYFRVRFRDKSYQAHRLAFWWVHGWMPLEVDHKDNVKWNNRICNLRQSEHCENQRNIKLNSRNTSGVKGVTVAKRDNRRYWVSKVICDGKLFSKYFPYTQDGFCLAAEWVKAVREKQHKDFSNHG